MSPWIYLLLVSLLFVYILVAHHISYYAAKEKIGKERKWDLNICCGYQDCGGVNADIVKHENVPNFVKVDDVYKLPFKDKEFENVLCSHTIEHVENPELFFKELQRVGEKVTLVIPPLWDLSASMLNPFEHKSIFLTLKKRHTTLPKFIKHPWARFVQKLIGQKING